MDFDPTWEPEGTPILHPPATLPSLATSSHLAGKYISLIPLSTSHAPALYSTLGGATHAQTFKYLPSGPYFSLASFSVWIQSLVEIGDFMYAITLPSPHDKSKTVREQEGKEEDIFGIACYSAPQPQHHSIEIGVILSPLLHHSTASTEISYLLLNHAFSILGYQRVEWRCNEANEASKRAAERLGFVKEGLLRRHQVVKGKARDTVVFGMLEDEWIISRQALEGWLKEENFQEGRQRRRLEDFRRQIGEGG